MKYLTQDQIWKGLGYSMPKSLEIASNSGIRIEQLEKQKETSTYVIMGCLILFSCVIIYNAIKNRSDEWTVKSKVE